MHTFVIRRFILHKNMEHFRSYRVRLLTFFIDSIIFHPFFDWITFFLKVDSGCQQDWITFVTGIIFHGTQAD
jgi:hypothetical protein